VLLKTTRNPFYPGILPTLLRRDGRQKRQDGRVDVTEVISSRQNGSIFGIRQSEKAQFFSLYQTQPGTSFGTPGDAIGFEPKAFPPSICGTPIRFTVKTPGCTRYLASGHGRGHRPPWILFGGSAPKGQRAGPWRPNAFQMLLHQPTPLGPLAVRQWDIPDQGPGRVLPKPTKAPSARRTMLLGRNTGASAEANTLAKDSDADGNATCTAPRSLEYGLDRIGILSQARKEELPERRWPAAALTGASTLLPFPPLHVSHSPTIQSQTNWPIGTPRRSLLPVCPAGRTGVWVRKHLQNGLVVCRAPILFSRAGKVKRNPGFAEQPGARWAGNCWIPDGTSKPKKGRIFAPPVQVQFFRAGWFGHRSGFLADLRDPRHLSQALRQSGRWYTSLRRVARVWRATRDWGAFSPGRPGSRQVATRAGMARLHPNQLQGAMIYQRPRLPRPASGGRGA